VPGANQSTVSSVPPVQNDPPLHQTHQVAARSLSLPPQSDALDRTSCRESSCSLRLRPSVSHSIEPDRSDLPGSDDAFEFELAEGPPNRGLSQTQASR
jgi:hypothetical protein